MRMRDAALRRTSLAVMLVLLSAAALAADAQADPKHRNKHDRGRHRDRDRHCTTEVVRHRRAPARVYVAPRPVYRPVRVVHRPVYVCEPQIVRVERRPYYWNAAFEIYMPRVYARVGVGDRRWNDCCYHDPYCNQDFRSIRDYRNHLRRHSHQPVLDVAVHGEYDGGEYHAEWRSGGDDDHYYDD